MKVGGIPVNSIRVPLQKFKKGPVPPCFVVHSKGVKQILLERELINEAEVKKFRSRCTSKHRKENRETQAAKRVAEGGSVDVPLHKGDGLKTSAGASCCCLDYLLSVQADFKAQENAVKEYVRSRGHFCIFLPKYHPELNFIERYWGRAKWYMREHCDYSLSKLWELSEVALGPGNCDLTLMRRYARTSWRWMDAYSKGLSGPMAAFAVRLCSKHRGISEAVERNLNARAESKEKAAAAEAARLMGVRGEGE